MPNEGDLPSEFDTKVAKIRCRLSSAYDEVEFIYTYSKKLSDPAALSSSIKSNMKGMSPNLDEFYKLYEAAWVELGQLYAENGKGSEFPTEADKKEKGKIRSNYYTAAGQIETLKTEDLLKCRGGEASNLTYAESKPSKTLPRLNLPIFDGQLINWAKFRDSYVSMVHLENIPVIDKFQYLRASLVGPALATIASFKIEETNYALAWQAILDTYDNKRMLASAYLEQMLNFKPLHSKGTSESLNKFLSSVCDNIAAFKALEIRDESEFVLFYLANRCLDTHTRELFETGQRKDAFPTFDSLLRFVRDRILSLQLSSNVNPLADTSSHNQTSNKQQKFSRPPFPKDQTKMSLVVTDKPGKSKNFHTPKNKIQVTSASKALNADTQDCTLCNNGAHSVSSCPRFVDATPLQRQTLLQGWNGCLNCLSSKHKVQNCPSKWCCRICKERHHSALHSYQSSPNPIQSSPSSISVTTNLSASNHSQTQTVLGTALANIYDGWGRLQTIRLVLDCGSQNSFITNRCLKRLGLKMSKTNHMISGIGQTLFDGALGKVHCTIQPQRTDGIQLETEAIVVNTITSYLPHTMLPAAVIDKCKSFVLADPSFWRPGPVDFLLGLDLFTRIWTGSVKEITSDGPDLMSSIFGFVVMGRVDIPITSNTTSLLMIDNSDTLSFQLERFWELDQPTTISTPLCPEDLECEDHFVQTHYRLPNGRYVVRLPFRSEEPQLGDASSAVLRRFHSLERKFENNSDIKQKYHSFMTEYLDLHHMSAATSPAKYLIPHHCITKEGPDDLKLKVVFDASAQAPNGSLNDHLMRGQKLQNDIKGIILRFRHHRYAFSTDIVKMFRMIEIDPADRQYMQIYWRFDQNEPIQRFELNTVSYGLVCAPFLAQRVLKQLALDHGEDFPLAKEALIRDSYVDDFLTGASTLTETAALRDQLINLLQCGGFQLGKWSSNSTDLVEMFKTPSFENPVDLSSPDEEWVKVLGLQWDPRLDAFSFSTGEPNANHTKRGVLSTLARLYDPLGFITPTTFLMKTFIQDLWIAKVGWDQDITHVVNNSWKNLISELPRLSELRIPRCFLPNDAISFRIVGFADASTRGYAAVIYLRVTTQSRCCISLISAKSKLAPTKIQSIPRLELAGALLLAELFSVVQPNIQLTFLAEKPPIFFTDSTIALAWINSPAHKLKVFAANRVAKIQELTAPASWRHVVSEENPADAGSRGVLPSQLLNHKLWWLGPTWLSLPTAQWPCSNPDLPSDIPEMKALNSTTLISTVPSDHLIRWISRFSSYMLLIKSAAWLQRWLSNLKIKKDDRFMGPLTRAEVEQGLLMCIKATQAYYFHDQKQIQEKYKDLHPTVDSEGFWRVGGRLAHAFLSESRKHPFLIPSHAHFAVLLVDHHHRIYLHPGPTTLQAVIQRTYWIPNLRRLIRQRGFKCNRCYKSRAAPVTPLMGNLPSYRVNGGQIFQHVGIDFAGPFPLKESNRRNAAIGKVYLCLFVCMATKALHLEAVTRLTTEAFLASFTRFTSRRGIPSDVYTDNGSNFLGAASYLKELYRWFSSRETKQHLLNYAIETKINWHFNPPQSPHMGGIWEAGVKSVKRHMRLIASGANLTYEEISTWFAKIEAVLNSRPLCPLSTDPNENNYLSPGHFLVGRPLIVAPEPSLLDVREHILSRWQLVSKMTQRFWERWSSEYLVTLQRRPKWIKIKPNLEVGDLVLIKEPSPPLHWKLARITAVHPGDDGVVRVVTIQRGNSTLRRHVTNLVPLPHLSLPSYPKLYSD